MRGRYVERRGRWPKPERSRVDERRMVVADFLKSGGRRWPRHVSPPFWAEERLEVSRATVVAVTNAEPQASPEEARGD
jgi:hypothetical protein